MHTYGGITPMNVWDIDFDVLRMLVDAASPKGVPGGY